MRKVIPKLIGAYLNTMALAAPSKVGEVGFNFFCTPIVPPVKKKHMTFLDTADRFHFVSNGKKLQAYRWGAGERKVIFLHGWQSHSFRWKKYIESFLGDDFTMYAFDAPAHGLSEGKYINIPIYSDAIKTFVNEVGGAEAVVTHSMGSFSILHALHEHPAMDISRLVLMSSPGEARDFVSFYQNATGLNDRTLKFILDYFVKTLNRTPDFYSAARFASAVQVPGLIIHDRGDDEAPYHYAERIHAAWPQSRLITTEGYGHNLKSFEVVRLVRDYVGERVSERV